MKIFISYRRADSQAIAGRIAERLQATYGSNAIYMDIHAVPPGVDFRDHIASAIMDCDVALVLIGDRWLIQEPNKPNRLFEPGDFVRIEIEAALSRAIPVIPVIVGKAQFPQASDLPPSLSSLVYRGAVHIDDGLDFHPHIDRLVRRLNENLKKPVTPTPPPVVEISAPSTTDLNHTVDHQKETSDGQSVDALPNVDSRAPPDLGIKPNFAPIHLTFTQGLEVVLFLLVLNSILAALGSMLWTDLHYWPAYMVSGLACAYFRYWGFMIAVLSPIVSSLLRIGGAPAYLYVPSNALQGALIITAFVCFRIDPSLARLEDKIKYMTLGVVAPSICGASLAWWLRQTTGIGHADGPLAEYTFWWVLENLTPVLFPGFWLHSVIGSLRRPFAWKKESYWTGWVGQTLEYTVPWTATLFLSLSISLFLVTSRLGETDLSADAWSQIQNLSSRSHVFSGLVFATSISMLIAVGIAVRHARQAWQLEEAIHRHIPSKEEAERLLTGTIGPSKRRTVSLVVFTISNFGDATRSLRPAILIDWLNMYFDCLSACVERFGGQVDSFNPENTLVIFGARDEELFAISSLRCAMEAVQAFRQIGARLAEKNISQFNVAIGVHSGSVVTGEVGSMDRRHYTVVGDTVDVANRVVRAAGASVGQTYPILCSLNTIKEAGIFAPNLQRVGLVEVRYPSDDGTDPLRLCAIADPILLRQTLILNSNRSIS